MTDKVQEDFQFEGANIANKDLGDSPEGRSILASKTGSVILDAYEREAKLKSENVRDSLTGLYNYRFLSGELEKRTRHHDKKLSLIWIDMDNLKSTNDQYGHEGGNQVIKGLARILTNKVRPNDEGFVSRYGGDEFVIVIPGDINIESLRQRGEEIRKAVTDAKFRVGKTNIQQTVSIGLGSWNGIETSKQFLERVDKAMYEAKKSGRNLVVEAI